MKIEVGYARVSSVGQSLEIQLEKLKNCPKIFQEKKSGSSNNRPELEKCLDYLREGDMLVVSRLDRLARSTLHLCEIAERIEKKKVELKVIDQNIDTSSATGRLTFHMLAAIAQFETELRYERQKEGIKKAKDKGVHFGRKATLSQQEIIALKQEREEGLLIKDLCRKYHISKSSIYRYLADQ